MGSMPGGQTLRQSHLAFTDSGKCVSFIQRTVRCRSFKNRSGRRESDLKRICKLDRGEMGTGSIMQLEGLVQKQPASLDLGAHEISRANDGSFACSFEARMLAAFIIEDEIVACSLMAII
jgi:hypothetical protein